MESRHALQLIDIVEHLYNCGIIHRDIHPNNLMFDTKLKHVKLIDFGFAATFENDEKKKKLKIAGVISYATLDLLEIYSKRNEDGSSNFYEYERTFDLSCAFNVIMYLKDVKIHDEFNNIKHGVDENKIKTIMDF